MKKRKKKISKNSLKKNMELLLLTLPAIIVYFIFSYIPMFGVIIAFKDYKAPKGILGSAWNGIENFKFFFTSQDAWRITRNTVGYALIFIAINLIAGVFVALLLYEVRSKKALKFYQTSMMLPRFLSWVIVGYITYTFLSPTMGIINQVIQFFGGQSIDWYSKVSAWPWILVITNTWKVIGLNCIMYYAALMGVDKAYFEAAQIDGANRLQQIIHISIPSIKPLMIVLTLLAFGNIFRGDFGLFYVIPRDVGVLYPATDIIDTYVYRGLRTGNLGTTAAVGLFQSLVGFVMIVTMNGIVRKVEPESSLF
ncbi:sugar ABC transporter permease [Vallitalea longa]|uniref:Sugar ABC transporter permease n=1 Tax=Vallitalea longa TaxID=2936439 RepID=A0A9W5YA48_9FIRM|nr:ABC transporter permease subunit [Vallitalea longa]GKX28194.1 sugar ABC transporter permease [Vallitalea longa]